jgi:hypothetical protein
MDSIPTELSHEIFIKLALKDKIQCLSVCHSWYNMLDKHGLLYKLDITSRQYHKLKDMIERLPHRGAQAEYLTFRFTVKLHVDKRKLCNIFPNLREIIFKGSSSQRFQNHMSRPFQFVNSTSKLEKIVDYGECELTRQLAMSNLCNKLKTLELDVRYLVDSVISGAITQLKNMPVLEHLGFRGYKVTLMDLEIMHCHLPTIKSLHFGVHILSGDMPRDVLSSGLITKLRSTIYSVPDLLTRPILQVPLQQVPFCQ